MGLWLALSNLTRSGPVQRLPELGERISSTSVARDAHGDLFLFLRERQLCARPVTGGATRVLHRFPARGNLIPEFVADGDSVAAWARGAEVSAAWQLSLGGEPPRRLRLPPSASSIRAWCGGLVLVERVETGRRFRCSWRPLSGGPEVELWSGSFPPRLNLSQQRLMLTVGRPSQPAMLLFTSPRERPARLADEVPGESWGEAPVSAGGQVAWLEFDVSHVRLVRWKPGSARPARTLLPVGSRVRLFSDGQDFWLLLPMEGGVTQALHRVRPDGTLGPPSRPIPLDLFFMEMHSGYFYYLASEMRENWLSWSGEGLIQKRHMIPHRVRLGRT